MTQFVLFTLVKLALSQHIFYLVDTYVFQFLIYNKLVTSALKLQKYKLPSKTLIFAFHKLSAIGQKQG